MSFQIQPLEYTLFVVVALKTFLQLVIHMNLDVHLRKVEPAGHVAVTHWATDVLDGTWRPWRASREGCLWIDVVLGTQVPGLQDQWLWFFFFLNYLTEDIPLTTYVSLKTCLSTRIPLKGAFCFLQNMSLQRSHQLWARERLRPFMLEEESGFSVAAKMLAF